MNLTIKSQAAGLHIDLETLKALGVEGAVDAIELEVRVEGQRLVVEASRGARLQRLSEDLERLMASNAGTLPQLLD